MSRGRGGGGQSGGSRGGRGRGRGARGGGSSWPGEGRRLDEGEPSTRGKAQGGRGRGRGGPARGMGLRASAQNAVGYNYGTPLQSGQQTPDDEAMSAAISAGQDDDDDDDDDDIVLETHRKYVHTVKPHMEEAEAPQQYQPTNDAGPSMLLPASVSNLYARSPSNLIAMERAQRAMEGQVAGLIPTGPKSAHVHRMYGTLDAVHNRNKNRQQQQMQYPLPVSTSAGDKKKAGKFNRPADNSADDPCMAGIPRSTSKREMPSKYNFLGKGGSGNLQLPVKFEKASGEWRDGAWVRSADGKEIANVDTVREAAAQSDPFDRASGAGLGFHSSGHQQTAPLQQDDIWAMEREQHDEESDPIAALLKLHPGSTELQEGNEEHDETLGYYQGTMGIMQTSEQPRGVRGGDEEVTARSEEVNEEAISSDDRDVQAMDEPPSEDEEIILIPKTQGSEVPSQMVESDSEEERQLDAIIEQNGNNAGDNIDVKQIETGFFVDLTGEALGGPSEAIQYETSSAAVIGEEIKIEAVNAEMILEDSSEDDTKLTRKQPRAGGKKARNAAKKARRRARKSVNSLSEPLVAREGDSDLEWGSDGPPVQFRKKADQDTFVQGGPMQQLSLNVLPTPHSVEEEDEMLALALANSVEVPSNSKAGKLPMTAKSLKEAIMEDYMENAMTLDDDDDEQGGDMIIERRDEKKANKKTDLDALLQFMNGMDGQRKGKEMTLEDIAIENQMQEEDEWMTEESEGDDDEEEKDEKDLDAAVEKAERKALPGDAVDESDSDQSDSSEDDKPRKERKETWSRSDDSDSDDSDDEDDFDRHFSWADADEDFIKRLDKFANANGSILKGRDRKARNRLFKMIETGDFDDLDEEDMVIDNDDPVFGLGALQPVKGGKRAKKTWGADHVFAEQLESQWQKDRAQKADNKRKRAAERAAAAENPYHGTQIKKGTKKMAKKAARAERRANKQAGGRLFVDDDEIESESPLRHATNLYELDKQIQLFLRDTSKSTLSLSPMDKRARAQVHLLANCYNLTSKSIGNGTKRFPTLIKNQRSGFNVNFAKVNSVLNGSRGSFGSGYKARDSNGVKVKDRASGVGAHVPKNQEGTAVGFGADRIGEENIGHRLLTMMGWSEGLGVGRTQGSAEPVGATIKVTKCGLGF